MYPRLSDIFKDLFGITLPFPIYSFGAMLAVAFLVAAWLFRKQLDRLYEVGRVPGVRVKLPDEKKKRKTVRVVSPSALVGTITVIAVVAGIVGAKVFHVLENLPSFARDPLGMIFSTGGLTFYGGLIVAAGSISWYVRKKGLPLGGVADAVAPSLMLAYGIGRIGCHLAGDGDWGITSNLAAKPGWIPTWLWAEDYTNNILGVTLPEPGVYPTSLYEFMMCLALFGVLWALRKHPFLSGWLFFLYLVFAAVERFLIEQIRVNNTFDLFGMTWTQAELISVLLFVVGLAGLVRTSRRYGAEPAPAEPAEAASSPS